MYMNNSSTSYQKGEEGGGVEGMQTHSFQRLWEITVPSPDRLRGGGGVLCTMNNPSAEGKKEI